MGEGNYEDVKPYKNGYKVEGNYLFTGKLDKPILLVTGNCKIDRDITSLEGCPERVEGDFNCRRCNNITSLKGCPIYVGGNFYCIGCENLSSLIGCPSELECDFCCCNCNKLVSLKGSPRLVGGDFACFECNNLSSLEGSPDKVEGNFLCYSCDNLKSLKGSPKYVGGKFDCRNCNKLISLQGSPDYVGGDFNCSDCNSLKSLKFLPKEIGGSVLHQNCKNLEDDSTEGSTLKSISIKDGKYVINGNFFFKRKLDKPILSVTGNVFVHKNVTSLVGCPEHVGGNFDCSDCNNLDSLKGAPNYVGGNFDCSDCKNLRLISGAPEYVGKSFKCRNNKNLLSLDGCPKHVEDVLDFRWCWNIRNFKGLKNSKFKEFWLSDWDQSDLADYFRQRKHSDLDIEKYYHGRIFPRTPTIASFIGSLASFDPSDPEGSKEIQNSDFDDSITNEIEYEEVSDENPNENKDVTPEDIDNLIDQIDLNLEDENPTKKKPIRKRKKSDKDE